MTRTGSTALSTGFRAVQRRITDTLAQAQPVDPEPASLESRRQEETRDDAPVLLEVDGLESPGRISDISLTVHEGEIVGLAGLLGSGRSEVLHGIFGSDAGAKGRVRLRGRALRRSARANVRLGLALVPEERMRQGLVPDWEIWRNTSLPDLADLSVGGVVPSQGREVRRARQAIREGVAVLAEACAFAERAGIDAAKIPQALAGGRADSSQLQEMFPKMVRSDFSITGRAALMLKDLELIHDLARQVGAPMPVTAGVTELFRKMVADGLGDHDNTEMVNAYRGQR